jgi:hypothetical protein
MKDRKRSKYLEKIIKDLAELEAYFKCFYDAAKGYRKTIERGKWWMSENPSDIKEWYIKPSKPLAKKLWRIWYPAEYDAGLKPSDLRE